ncbi:Uncharacterized protein APZ42_019286 [Daphnia magna]|uniref:Uncharacterized protein n=1 Tax=Daphnia magna TaxID=35525 RepID=A0A164YG39_9CRUS|nr:Uncharacterized protein APZ42_019286 [Daphnia magna]
MKEEEEKLKNKHIFALGKLGTHKIRK